MPARSFASIRGGASVVGDLTAIASGRVAAAVLSFTSALMVTRLLGPAGYGTVALVTITATLVFTASTAWTGVAVRRYGREELERGGGISGATWNRVVIGSPLLAASLAVVVGLKVSGILPHALTWQLLALALLSAVAMVAVDHWVCLLETAGRLKTSAACQVASQASYVVVLAVAFCAGARISPSAVIALSLGASVFFVLGAIPVVWRLGIVPVGVDRPLLRRMLRLSTPQIGLVASQYVIASADIVVLRIFRSPTEVGVYAVAYQAYAMLSAPAMTATTVFLPLFVSLELAQRGELIDRYLERAVPALLFVVTSAAGVTVPLLPLAMPLLFGGAFSGAGAPLAVLVSGLVLLTGSYLVAPILILHEATRTIAATTALAAAINVTGDVLLIGLFHVGIIAPAIATSSALAIVFGGFYSRARRLLGTRRRPDPAVFAPIAAGLIPTLAVRGPAGEVAGLVAAVAASLAIVLWRCPFCADDAAVVAQLAMPSAVRRAALRAIALVT